MENNNNLGQVKISNDVIVTIAGLAALEVEGVETITSLTDKLLKNNGVKIQQENVKNTVETMTGLEVSQVNIQVQEISFKKEKEEKELAKQAKKEEAKLAKQAKKEETKKSY